MLVTEVMVVRNYKVQYQRKQIHSQYAEGSILIYKTLTLKKMIPNVQLITCTVAHW